MFCYDALCHYEENIKPNKLRIITSTDLSDIPKLATLRNQYPKSKIGFGIHPWFVQKTPIEELKALITQYKPDFIGEIGLDYLHPEAKLQQEIFTKQLNLAREFNLPVIIHSIRAYNDVLRILKAYKLSGIIHGFNGHNIIAKEFTKLGFLLGIGSNISKNSKITQSIKNIGINSLVFESDAPFSSSFNKNVSISDDTFLYAQIVAKKLDINLVDLIEYSNSNLQNLFK